jgi:hypothetical protein
MYGPLLLGMFEECFTAWAAVMFSASPVLVSAFCLYTTHQMLCFMLQDLSTFLTRLKMAAKVLVLNILEDAVYKLSMPF